MIYHRWRRSSSTPFLRHLVSFRDPKTYVNPLRTRSEYTYYSLLLCLLLHPSHQVQLLSPGSCSPTPSVCVLYQCKRPEHPRKTKQSPRVMNTQIIKHINQNATTSLTVYGVSTKLIMTATGSGNARLRFLYYWQISNVRCLGFHSF